MARAFNGSTQSLSRSAVPLTALPVSFFARFKTTSATDQALIALSAGAGTVYSTLRVDSTGVIRMEQFDGSANPIPSAGSGLADGAWHSAGGVIASTTSRTAYADGVAGTPSTTSCSATAISGCDTTAIGVIVRPTPAYWFNGSIAEAAIWSVALTDADMAALALGLSPLFVRPDALVFYAPLMGQYAPEIDLIGHRDLTVTGATAAAHPRIYVPSGPQAFTFKAGAAPPANTGAMFQVF
jgi:hypothetical protein